jgi:myo-inositol 2-dehydrogenase/D-chiro-inositol 1-dehydrogenase
MVAASEVDAVIVATPPETHLPVARVAMSAGVPLLIEKPLAPTVSEAVEIDAIRKATGTPVMVGLNRRWWKPVAWLREELARSETGPAAAELVFVTQATRWLAIAGTRDLLDDLATHQLDLLRFVFAQEIEAVSVISGDTNEISMRVRLMDCTTAVCRVAHDGHPAEWMRVTTGNGRSYRIDAKSNRATPASGLARAGLDLGGLVWRRLARQRSSLLRSFERQLRAFVLAVRNGTEPTPGIADGIAAVRAVAAARQSLTLGGVDVKPV